MDKHNYHKALAACLYDYRSPPDRRDIDNDTLATNPNEQGHDILQRALRHLAGEDTEGRVCADGALSVLAPLLDLDGMHPATGVLSDTRIHVNMRANCIAAYAYLSRFNATPEQVSAAALDAQRLSLPDGARRAPDAVDSILRAIDYANQAARMQFISNIVLHVGATFRDLTEHLGLDVWSFKQYAPLWQAVERHECKLFDDKHSQKSFTKSEVPRCAAPGCFGCLEGEDLWEFCRGNCAWIDKPWYCSTTCRAEEWENHRASCKPPRASSPVKLPSSVTLDWKVRDLLIRKLVPNGPVEQLEIVPEDVNTLDARNGTVVRAWDMPSPYVEGETVKCVVKCYT